jgi:hypothetical protein
MTKRSATMTLLTLELEPELYEHLRQEAVHRKATVKKTAQTLLVEQLKLLVDTALSESEQVTAVLQAAGLLTELSAEEKKQAEQVDVTLEEVIADLDAAGGQPLSELIIEMRGPKV